MSGTYDNRAPEKLLKIQTDIKAADMWSIGMIFYEMLSLTPLITTEEETPFGQC